MNVEVETFLRSVPVKKVKEEDIHMKTNTYFARTVLIHQSGGNLFGNFSASFSEACINHSILTIQSNSVIKVTQLGNCANGQQITMLECY